MIELTYTFEYPSDADGVLGDFVHFLNNLSYRYSEDWDEEVKNAYNVVKKNKTRIQKTIEGGKTVKISSRIDIPELESALRIILKQLYRVEFSAPGSIKF